MDREEELGELAGARCNAFLLRSREVSFPFTSVGADTFCFCRVADLRGEVAIRAV